MPKRSLGVNVLLIGESGKRHGGYPVATSKSMRRRAIERMMAHRLFHRMVVRQGIDLAGCGLPGLEEKIVQSLRKCELCAQKQVCRGWVQSDRRLASYVAFCPNSGLIETCRILDPDALPLHPEPPEAAIRREPSLAEMLAEPIIKLVMASDHVGAAQLQEPATEPAEALLAGRSATANDAGVVKDLVMPEALAVLRQEHRNMVTLLQTLEWQVDEFENGNQPDYDVIGATLDYFLRFPDVYHHPKEELIFAKLQERDLTIAQHIGDLGIAHQELATRAHEFATALRAVLEDVEVSREAFARWARGFIELQQRHIDMEESTFFPAAEKSLSAKDWTDLEAAMTTEDDPLFGVQVGERFEQLRKTILVWQAQDQTAPAKE
jgi:hemerythrin-like domain-containing protein